VTTTIFPGRRPRDVWTFGADALPLLLRSLRVAGGEGDALVRRHAGWLGPEVERYGATAIDPATGLVRDDRAFSSHRDTLRTRSNAANNAMLVLADRVLRETGWFPSPARPDVRDRFLERFRRPDGTMVDRPDTGQPTGDAAVLPWFIGALDDADGLAEALAGARRAGLADPLPLRYASRRDPAAEDPVQRRLVPDYQGTAVWTSLGGMYLRLAQRAAAPDAAAVESDYRAVVERDRTIIEVYDGSATRLAALHRRRADALGRDPGRGVCSRLCGCGGHHRRGGPLGRQSPRTDPIAMRIVARTRTASIAGLPHRPSVQAGSRTSPIRRAVRYIGIAISAITTAVAPAATRSHSRNCQTPSARTSSDGRVASSQLDRADRPVRSPMMSARASETDQ
jgi:hypothetical protein